MKFDMFEKIVKKQAHGIMKEVKFFYEKHPSAKRKNRRLAMADLLHKGKAFSLEEAWRKTAGVR